MSRPFTCFVYGDERDLPGVCEQLRSRGIHVQTPGLPGADASITATKPDLLLELTLTDPDAKRKRLAACVELSAGAIPILSASTMITAGIQTSWVGDGAILLGIGYLPGQFGRGLLEVAPTEKSSRAVVTAAEDFAIRLGMEISVVQDRAGLVFPRVLSGLVNEAFFAIMEGAADAADIDTAMKLGTNYPSGPVEWGNSIGLGVIVAVLDAIHAETGEERYRVSPLLRQVSTLAR